MLESWERNLKTVNVELNYWCSEPVKRLKHNFEEDVIVAGAQWKWHSPWSNCQELQSRLMITSHSKRWQHCC